MRELSPPRASRYGKIPESDFLYFVQNRQALAKFWQNYKKILNITKKNGKGSDRSRLPYFCVRNRFAAYYMSKYVCFPSIFTFPISHFLPYSFPIILIVIGTAARRKSVFLEPRIGPGPSPRPPIPSIRVVYEIATPHYKFNHCILALYFMLFLSFKYILFS